MIKIDHNTTLYSTLMLSLGIEVVNLEIAKCRQMMEEYIHKNRKLWYEFLSELNPDLLKSAPQISIRHHLLPGDVGYITYLHAVIYSPEHGWDRNFDTYAIVKFSENIAQLRWLLLHPEVRGQGLGRKLVEEALQFSREAGYSTVFLWTVSTLPAAAGLYRSMGFEERENVTHEIWGGEVTEVKYQLELK